MFYETFTVLDEGQYDELNKKIKDFTKKSKTEVRDKSRKALYDTVKKKVDKRNKQFSKKIGKFKEFDF